MKRHLLLLGSIGIISFVSGAFCGMFLFRQSAAMAPGIIGQTHAAVIQQAPKPSNIQDPASSRSESIGDVAISPIRDARISIPLHLAKNLHIDPLVEDLQVNADIRTIFQLNDIQEKRINQLLKSAATTLREFETERMMVAENGPQGTVVLIPPIEEGAGVRSELVDSLAAILGQDQTDLFMHLLNNTFQLAMSGEFGKFARRIRIEPSDGTYRVLEANYTTDNDGNEKEHATVGTTFEKTLPSRLQHLFTLASTAK
jgi:hypothetical protein